MKRHILTITILIVLALSCHLFAQNFELAPEAFRVNTQKNTTEITFQLPDYSLNTITKESQSFSRISLGNIEMTTEEGLPELPIFAVSIAVPLNSNVHLLSETAIKKDYLDNILLYPAQSGDEEAQKNFSYNTRFYQDNSHYPAQTTVVSDVSVMRDYAFVNVNVQPFVYNAQSKQLEVNKEIKIVIEHHSRSGENQYQINNKISRAFEPIYESMFANYEQIRSPYPLYQKPTLLILYPTNELDLYMIELNKLINWKKQKGFNVKVATGSQIGITTTTIKAYIQNAYDTWEDKPEYIMLIGDHSSSAGYAIPTWTNIASYGAGDYPYTWLAGGANDVFGDAIIGRMSIAGISDFQTLVSKVMNYERAPTSEGTSWMNKNLLVAQRYSNGISYVNINQYAKSVIHDFDQNHTFIEQYSITPSPTQMVNAVNTDGVLTFNFRGWIEMSGFNSSSVNSLTNVKKLFNAVFITCSTGSFDGTSIIEDVIRAGTAQQPKGAITSVGLATSSTHTAYNNALDGAIFHAMYKGDIPTMGGATLFAKYYIHRMYAATDLTQAKNFAHWLNLMGDPTISIYRTIAKTFNVIYPTSVPAGTNFITIEVQDQFGQPVKNSWVAITQNNEHVDFAITDETGIVNLKIPTELESALTIVVSNDDYVSKMLFIQPNEDEAAVSLNDYIISDAANGNNNHQINPNETIKFDMSIKNYTNSAQTNLNLTLRCNSPYATILDSTAIIANINANAVTSLTDAFNVQIAQNCPSNLPIEFTLIIQSGNETWKSMIFETVKAVDLDIASMNVVGSSYVQIGTPTNIYFTVMNNGVLPAENVLAKLKSESLFLQVIDSLAVFGSINPGSTANNQSSQFTVQALTGIFPGVKLKAKLIFYNDSGYEETEEVYIQVGNIQSTDPLPPDDYGYIVYDITDTAYEDAPVYNWIEISSIGTSINTNDTAENLDDVQVIDLPFPFKMYGETYTRATICSNGWMALGETEAALFRNTPLPGPIAPRPMIAPYWNDLRKSGTNSGIYSYYNSEEDIFIVQWNNMSVAEGSGSVTFQLILYNPTIYGTPLGDGPIKFQYKTFSPGAQGTSTKPSNYFTCGIQDHTATVGIQYANNNQYSPGAATLGNETALYFTHPFFLNEAPYILANTPIIHDQNGNNVIEAGEIVNIGLPILNVGLTTAHNVTATVLSNDPFLTILNPTASYINVEPSGTEINTDYLVVQVSPLCPTNYTFNLLVDISCDEGSWLRPISFKSYRPSLTYRSYMINDTDGNANGILEAGEHAKLIINLVNSSNLKINNVNLTINSTHPGITINQNSTNTPSMLSNSSYQNVFDFQLDNSLTEQTAIPVSAIVTSDNALTLNFDIMLGINQSGALLQETFNNWLPSGWTIQQFSNNWSLSQTDNAGGTAPEVKFSGTPAFNNITRLVSTTMDASDISSAILSFKQKINVNAPGTTIGIATSAMYSPWHVIWTEVLTESVDAEIKNIPINNSDLNKNNFQISFFIEGQSDNIDEWYIDDVTVLTDVGNTAIMFGNVAIDDPDFDIRRVSVKANEYIATPDEEGNYALYLIPGYYSTISAIAPYTQSNQYSSMTIDSSQIIEDIDFDVNYMYAPINLIHQMNPETHVMTLNWTHNLPETSPFTLTGFDIFKQVNSGTFDFLANTTDTYYTETLNPDFRYRYYVLAHYTIGVSDSSNVLYVDPNIVDNNENVVEPIKFNLAQNYPNPFNPTTNIAFSIPDQSRVNLAIYNIKGQLVKQLKNEVMSKGHYTVQWNGQNDNNRTVGSGIYFIRLNTEKQHSIRKALLLK
ncbi:MAG TPA: C25 family cysteine peptidase [Candidatus Cloacimonadota bacterium]|nr:C25 family cysteine peptidase [Candidatus Cloacimonadota bacterium]HQB40919.1 C25 family cysteine peptidase [Candidatus Cloacimonadota bacterium]